MFKYKFAGILYIMFVEGVGIAVGSRKFLQLDRGSFILYRFKAPSFNLSVFVMKGPRKLLGLAITHWRPQYFV